ncbi:MAG TPA: MFS transporter [Acidimicrobiia bacterium]|nr:MFS transporter [Acidimicrobiia bacterium]
MLSDRNALRVALARFISRSGAEAAFFVGIWGKAAYEFDGTAAQIALVIAALGVSSLIGSAAAGTLVDRFDPRKVLLVAEVLFVPAALSLIFATSLTMLIVLSGVLGLVTAPINTAIASFPPFLTDDPDRLSKMNSLVEMSGMAALITGTAIGGALAKWVSIDAIFVFDAVTSILAMAVIYGVRLAGDKPDEVPIEHNSMRDLREGIRFSFASNRLRFYLLAGASVWTMFGLFSALEPLFFRDILDQPPETIGFVNTIFGIGLVIGTSLVARLPRAARSARAVLVLVALNGLGAILYVGTSRLPIVVAGGFVWAVMIGVFVPIVRTMLHVNSPRAMVGRVMSVSQMLGELGKLGPLTAAPLLATIFGIQQTLAGGGVILAIAAFAFWRVARHLDATRTVPVDTLEGPVISPHVSEL